MPLRDAIPAFLLAFPALFSIVNPIAGAFIFREATAGRTHDERQRLAWHIGRNALLVMLVALWGGAYVLNFFGISLAALRIAGGVVVSVTAWNLLSAPEQREARKQQEAAPASSTDVASMDDVAFFPLTIPITTGPGTISVAIALGAGHPSLGPALPGFFLGVTAAATALALVIWIAYRSADTLSSLIGPTAGRALTRISAFLLLCIGVQIMITGVQAVLPH
ncbi:MAG TPA: MarC family protein [Acetobacteraceae bacterium]|nr:MarC family protein [Acetobacteraceae bacterium]